MVVHRIEGMRMMNLAKKQLQKKVKKKVIAWLILSNLFTLLLIFFFCILMLGLFFYNTVNENNSKGNGNFEAFNGVFTEGLPIFSEVKGRGQISDEIAQYAVGVGVKYRILPSLAIGQWAYESAWGKSAASQSDNNYFGITWYVGSPFPRGTPRGIGGNEGGNYMRFPSKMESFNYYGYMLAKQPNFNKVVGTKDLGMDLDIIHAGGYAAAGTGKGTAYYQAMMDIYQKNDLKGLDDFAISKWGTQLPNNQSIGNGKGDISVLNNVLGTTVNGGQCYGLTAYYVEKMGGPQLMGSGKMFASAIGEDYDWPSYGWQVIRYPKAEDIRAGDILNWETSGTLATSVYGHTGVVTSVSNGGQSFGTVEQNAERGQIVSQYQRAFGLSTIKSIVRKVK
ncbi:glucosaminidase domain-containing protein [Enterococcus faecalis]|uniref:glucosaminidase domain-containing protein n=1 Tax=Enterococcus faecalis TaxID=1351 RepID=UPI002985DE19|nr:glucosaminidase domain-containing protein [Enterococcus faecalis]EIT2042677.1 glucosaminidase domain-containing protein [Enterococcus faecalis]